MRGLPWVRLVVVVLLVAAASGGVVGGASAGVGPVVVGVGPSGGPVFGGVRVTITGSGLVGVRAVRFGVVPAPWFEPGSGSVVVAEAPPGEPGVVEVTVVVAGPGGDVVSRPAAGARFTYGVGVWRDTDPLTLGPVGHTATQLADGQVLVIGGRSGTGSGTGMAEGTAVVEVFDPAALNGVGGRGEWSKVAGLENRSGHTATLLGDGRVLVAGGRDGGGGVLGEGVLYGPDGSWSPIPPMGQRREGHSATLLGDGRVLVAGGIGVDGVRLASAEVFDPVTATWAAVPPMGGRAFSDGVTASGSDVVTSASAGFTAADGGSDVHGPSIGPGVRILEVVSSTSIRLSAPATESGSGLSFSFNLGRAENTATLLGDGSVLVVGGEAGRNGDTVTVGTAERFVPGSPPGAGRWVPAAGLAALRSHHTATALGDGRVVVTGGRARSRHLASVEIYDPVLDRWSPAGSMGRIRSDHTAALLDDGRVLVVGGFGMPDPAVTKASVEVFQPAAPGAAGSGQWILGPPMGVGRARSTATVLHGPACAKAVPASCGRVLVVGGVDGGNERKVELFDSDPARPVPTLSRLTPADASTAGAQVMISGNDLRGATSVTFGSTPAVFQVVSNQEIIATAPPHAVGPAEVTVATPAGPSLTPSLPSRFDYRPGAWNPTSQPPGCRDHEVSPGDVFDPCDDEYQTATPLTDGRVLLARGDGTASTYDPESEAWTPTKTPMAALRATRRHQTIVADGPVGALPNGRTAFTATRLGDGRVLVVGGCCDGHFSFRPSYRANTLRSAEIFDPATDTWQPTAPMRTQRFGHAAVLLADGRRVLVTGGSSDWDVAVVSHEAEIFDPDATDPATGIRGVWSDAGRMRLPRFAPTATLLPNGHVVVTGGYGHLPGVQCGPYPPLFIPCVETPQVSAEIYTPPTGTGGSGSWADGPDLKRARAFHTATRLPNGSVLVAGGAGGADPLTAEVLDPAGGSWRDVEGLMATVRVLHTATLLPNGTVLVAGGQRRGLPSAEVFDPTSGRWIITMALDDDRVRHAAALLGEGVAGCGEEPRSVRVSVGRSCGSLLVVGGFSDGSDPRHPPRRVAGAEVYRPAPRVAGVVPGRGPSAGGSEVVVRGSGFAGAGGVSFGGVEVPPCPAPVEVGCFRVDSPSRITALSPAQAKGPVPVGISGPGGISGLVVPAGQAQEFVYEVSRPPAGIADVTARAESASQITLGFTAPTADGPFAPAASAFVVKGSSSPIVDEASFTAAAGLCDGAMCRYEGIGAGQALALAVGGLSSGTTYHFALRAVNEAGMAGPVSNSAEATTAGVRPQQPVRPSQPTAQPLPVADAPPLPPAATGPPPVADAVPTPATETVSTPAVGAGPTVPAGVRSAPPTATRPRPAAGARATHTQPADKPAPPPAAVRTAPAGAEAGSDPGGRAKPTPLALPGAAPSSPEPGGGRSWVIAAWLAVALMGGLGLLGAFLNRRLRR